MSGKEERDSSTPPPAAEHTINIPTADLEGEEQQRGKNL